MLFRPALILIYRFPRALTARVRFNGKIQGGKTLSTNALLVFSFLGPRTEFEKSFRGSRQHECHRFVLWFVNNRTRKLSFRIAVTFLHFKDFF